MKDLKSSFEKTLSNQCILDPSVIGNLFLLLFGMTGVDAKSIMELGFCMRSPDEMERFTVRWACCVASTSIIYRELPKDYRKQVFWRRIVLCMVSSAQLIIRDEEQLTLLINAFKYDVENNYTTIKSKESDMFMAIFFANLLKSHADRVKKKRLPWQKNVTDVLANYFDNYPMAKDFFTNIPTLDTSADLTGKEPSQMKNELSLNRYADKYSDTSLVELFFHIVEVVLGTNNERSISLESFSIIPLLIDVMLGAHIKLINERFESRLSLSSWLGLFDLSTRHLYACINLMQEFCKPEKDNPGQYTIYQYFAKEELSKRTKQSPSNQFIIDIIWLIILNIIDQFLFQSGSNIPFAPIRLVYIIYYWVLTISCVVNAFLIPPVYMTNKFKHMIISYMINDKKQGHEDLFAILKKLTLCSTLEIKDRRLMIKNSDEKGNRKKTGPSANDQNNKTIRQFHGPHTLLTKRHQQSQETNSISEDDSHAGGKLKIKTRPSQSPPRNETKHVNIAPNYITWTLSTGHSLRMGELKLDEQYKHSSEIGSTRGTMYYAIQRSIGTKPIYVVLLTDIIQQRTRGHRGLFVEICNALSNNEFHPLDGNRKGVGVLKLKAHDYKDVRLLGYKVNLMDSAYLPHLWCIHYKLHNHTTVKEAMKAHRNSWIELGLDENLKLKMTLQNQSLPRLYYVHPVRVQNLSLHSMNVLTR